MRTAALTETVAAGVLVTALGLGLGLGCSGSQPAETTTASPDADGSGVSTRASGAGPSATASVGGAASETAAESADGEGGEAGGDDAGETACTAERRVVELTTSDGVTLQADYVASGVAGGPAVVLLHMIPPSNDRTNYPDSFVDALADAGFSVLNVDRRGAGGSEGVAQDAYEGPQGRLDAVAAIAFLASAACSVPATKTAIIGASNGTTTALDYATVAEPTERPAALAFLSPGGYTENQHSLAQGLAALEQRPVFVGYPPGERAWPEGARASAPTTWTFIEYAGGQHGSRLFSSNPEVADDLLTFLRAALGPR